MIKVLLVEDELIVRSGMKNLIDWHSHGFELIADVRHGEEALQVLEQEAIDIVITDIRMPVMDGLELMKEIAKRGFKCAIIVLSSFDEFRYVKESMKYGAKDYIHKPTMTPDELLQTLQRVVLEIKKSTMVNQYEKLLQETVVESREMILTKVCRQLLEMEAVDSKVLQILVGLPLVEEPLHMMLVRFIRPLSIGKDEEIISYSEEHLMKGLFPVQDKRVQSIFLKREQHWIIIYTKHSLVTEDKIINKSKEYNFETLVVHCMKEFSFLQLGSVYQNLQFRLEEKYAEWEEFHQIHSIIYDAMGYIAEHYMEPLTLEKICDIVHVSPTYFSRLFYKETGSNFIDYLTNYRMEKAKELLLQSDLRNYEISEKVGYKNSKYFMKVFKKYTGKTPGEYRKQSIEGTWGQVPRPSL